MTTPPTTSPAFLAAQRQVMTGVALVMGGCVFGGVTAIALHLMGQRTPAIIMAVIAGVVVVAGIAIQASGVRRLKAAQTPDT